ncbi:MAG: NAD(P)H-binding protein [Candidatus Promineifilaceae bacterium]|nr:NAD(P)H-binding protein [Candidatus Promineifilaceae bacterium]
MSEKEIHAVTGAYGYSGKYIARRLLSIGHQVITLTNSPQRENPFGERVTPFLYNFDHPEKLTESLLGVKVLYNTYWVRFNHESFQHASAVENTKKLFAAAKQAGVQRIVHVSITNPDVNSHLEYFSGKAELENSLIASGISCAILRPTVLFGKEDILINNIAWMLRKFPVFGVFGDGSYRLQPIYVDDLAQLAVQQGQATEDGIINAIGPETFTYKELVATIGRIIGKERPIISLSPRLGLIAGRIMNRLLDDVVITKEEIDGLMADLLYVDSAPTGSTPLTAWAQKHANNLGVKYSNELARRRDRKTAYAAA